MLGIVAVLLREPPKVRCDEMRGSGHDEMAAALKNILQALCL